MELRDWKIEERYNGYILSGNIYNDEKGRFTDGVLITTSRLKSIDFEKGIANTKNSTYVLKNRFGQKETTNE